MNKKAEKAYKKAMNYYEKGKINKALELCEEVLSEGLDNQSVLNFKGLLLYQKGNLDEAITVWKINKDLNNDDIANNYIKDVIADENRLELYKQGEQALKQLKVDKALDLFKICAESDYNSIKVNTGIALCYQKKGDFYKAKEYVDKALNIDKDAITAKIIEKELRENGLYLESENPSKGFLIGITILVIIISIIAGGYLVISKYKNKTFVSKVENEKSNEVLREDNLDNRNKESEVMEDEEVNKDNTPQEKTKEELKNTHIDKEKLKTLIANNDFDGIYEQLSGIDKESISDDGDRELYNNATNLIKDQGVSKFYEYGLWYFNNGNYSEAKISLDKAYAYCEGNSLKEHIMFYRASNTLKQSDNKLALVQYEEYYSQYPKGTYVQEALYELALLNNSEDKEKSKTYANTLKNNFPDSIYINDNIKDILKN